MVRAAGGDEVRGIGARLRAAREKRGLTVLQAAERLHVDARVLDALEAQDFDAVGADVYVRGHLRRYAELTGESPAQLLVLYAAGAHPAAPDLTRIPHVRPGSEYSRLMAPALMLVGGFGLAGLSWWVLSMQGEKAHPVAVAPASAAGAAAADDTLAAAAGEPATPAPGAGLPARRAPAARSGEAPGNPPSGAQAAQAQLALELSAQSWVEISDADGRRLLAGLIEAGSAHSIRGAPPLRVILGNAPAVALQVNGRPVAFTALVHHNGSAHLLIDGAGRASAAPPRLAHGD
jgi:cytoskeleton protein RodZ